MPNTKTALKSHSKQDHVGVLFSGGLDSAALIAALLDRKKSVWPIYVRAGLPWETTELKWAKIYLKNIRNLRLKKLAIIRISLDNAYWNNWSLKGKTPGKKSRDSAVFLPARNLLLITKAALQLTSQGINSIGLATLKENPFPDGKSSYFKQLQKILSASFKRPIRILYPFRNKKKKDVLLLARQYPIYLSLSCINPNGNKHCGSCNKCAERKKAFRAAGITDKTAYLN